MNRTRWSATSGVGHTATTRGLGAVDGVVVMAAAGGRSLQADVNGSGALGIGAGFVLISVLVLVLY